ncbi:Glycoprotein-N-acetylgalactosamine 3-beta-galactosyltransferase 1 [Strongyloides ratti]|uniref:N-acetylgalactosaminide beta-1,3-galactosyltransferase n=1 Tax=Strongyloides ratti TaxID=34506 RepID=A0A090MXG8_STRRB|nr:Glycoprotein-N-acetylgalactosamine 3-beta-galactosyltransferase 1 [Strongyloides ratti]CEF65409.1 Glycoprotein-N-acetylgalactosamine 3-beta-galactosyltransferase 1 [Strongyloides ratti]
MIKEKYYNYKIVYFLILQFYLLFFSNKICIGISSEVKINVKRTEYPKILCVIFSHPTKETSTLNHIIRTWLAHCDKALFITTTGEKFHDKGEGGKKMRIEVIKISSEGGRMDILRKTIKSFKIIYSKFFNNTTKQEYDWLLKVNDNSFVVIENLKKFLKNKNKNENIYYGYNSNFNKINKKKLLNKKYISGGSGYVISKNGIKNIFENKKNFLENCNEKIVNGYEDIIIGICFKKLGIKGGNSRDENGFETFLPPVVKKKYNLNLLKHEEMFNLFPGNKYECQRMSQYPISFHNIVSENFYILNYIFYKSKVNINIYNE